MEAQTGVVKLTIPYSLYLDENGKTKIDYDPNGAGIGHDDLNIGGFTGQEAAENVLKVMADAMLRMASDKV